MNKTNKKTAAQTYKEERAKADRLMSEIQEALSQRWAEAVVNGVNWQQVGDLVQVNQTLSNLADSLLQRGQYAPENRAVLPTFAVYRKQRKTVVEKFRAA